MKPIPFSEIKNLPNYNNNLDRPSAPQTDEIYRVMLWDDYHEMFTIFRFRRAAEADAKFLSLLINAQKKGDCVRILIVAPDDFEVQRVELLRFLITSIEVDAIVSWDNERGLPKHLSNPVRSRAGEPTLDNKGDQS